MIKLLVTGCFPLDEVQREELSCMGFDVCLHNDEKAPVVSPEQYEAVICNGLFLHQPLDQFSSLKLIQLTSAGMDRVPLEEIRKRNIRIFNARGVYSIPMAEFALCGVLQLMKQSRYFSHNQTAHIWQKHRGLTELQGKTVCIVGCGSVGTECAKRFNALGCSVIGVDLNPYEGSQYQKIYALSEINSCLSSADIVLLTLPLTDETYHIIGRDEFSFMKDGAILVNIARGAVVDTEALTEALQSKLNGAVLDVFEEEPLNIESSLWDLENVILTPHNSFVSDQNRHRLWTLIRQNLRDYLGQQ